MKKVLLMSTPFYRLMGSHYNGLSLGIGYISSVLREHGHQVALYNADYLEESSYLNQDQIFKNANNYAEILSSPDHEIWEEVTDRIVEYKPDVLGITMYTANLKAADIIGKKVKDRLKDTIIVAGGVHPTLDPMGTIKLGAFDYVISGEGEYAMLKLINGLPPEKIPGLAYKGKRGIKKNPRQDPISDLDSLPFPDRDNFLHVNSNINRAQIITGRGCPFSCTYCASPAMWGRKSTRFRSVEDVLQELEVIKDNYLDDLVYFFDDTLTLKRKRTLDLCRAMTERKYNIEWKCDTRADCLDEEVVATMKDAGCVLVKIGVETGSPRILKRIKKKESKEKILKAAKIVKESGIKLTAYLMAGFPGETDEDLRQTIDFAHELDADYYSLSILAPYYGTEIYEELDKSSKPLDKEHWEYFFHQNLTNLKKHTSISEEMIKEFLKINEGRNRI